MKTISIKLEDSIYEELGEMLNEMGQTQQTFYVQIRFHKTRDIKWQLHRLARYACTTAPCPQARRGSAGPGKTWTASSGATITARSLPWP